MNLLVHYGNLGYMNAKNEIHNILTQIGDQKSEQELAAPGVIGVTTKLDPRHVLEELHEIYLANPELFKTTKRWTPADHFCNPSDIKKIMREEIKDLMMQTDRYTITFCKHQSTLNPEQITAEITPFLKGTPVEEHPTKIISVELFDKNILISLLLPKHIFSLH